MKRTNDVVMFSLIGLASIVTLAVLLQRPADPVQILAACGFMVFTLGWTGMYFRLRRELPEHVLVEATYLNFPTGFGRQRRIGFRNMLDLIRVHFDRHHGDVWSILLIAGLVLLAASLVGAVL
jgi:hypothetical protein